MLILAVFVVSCSAVETQLPANTETPIPNTSTPQIVEVTRIVNAVQTVIVTATPEPLLAQDCFATAMTQADLNGCAAVESELAKAELAATISQINFSPDQKTAFEKLQTEWESRVWEECKFFYGQIIDDGNGHIHYAGGTMAPMRIGFCLADQYKSRTRELKFAYLGFGN
ncbi:MAG: DUF1311 domain-containing protein [Anaerolineales bacterium]|nr:DUF1311 domain-containing protein [Anaerolineales bacterium]